MRYRFLGILMISLAAALPAAAQFAAAPQAAPGGDDITYTMPSGWIAQPLQGGGPDVKAHYALYYQGMPYGEVYISYQPLAPGATLDQVFEQGLAQVRPNLPYYQARGTQRTSINGLPAIVHDFSYMPGGTSVLFFSRTYTLTAGAGVYTFFFQTVQNYFQAALSAFSQVMATVKANPRPANVTGALAAAGGAGAAGAAAPIGAGMVADDLGLNFDLPAGWKMVNDPAGAKYRRYDAGGGMVASLMITGKDDMAGLSTLFGGSVVSAAEDALRRRIDQEFKAYENYAPRATIKRKIAGYEGAVHDFDFKFQGRPAFWRCCAFAVPRKSDKPTVIVAPDVQVFSFIGWAAEQADAVRKEWDAIIDSMRPQGAPAPAGNPAPEAPVKRNPGWAAPPAKAKAETGLPALADDQPAAGTFADPAGRFTAALPEGAVYQKTENNAAWFKLPGDRASLTLHSCRDDQAAGAVAARLAEGKKLNGAPGVIAVDGRDANVALYTARDAGGENLAWLVASYKGGGLLIIVNLPAKDYAGAQGWIGSLLRSVKFVGR